MLKIYELLGDISCVEIVVTITPTRRIEKLEGWIGAHIRNMLLAATSEVKCGASESLMDKINHFSIEDDGHPWYKQLKGGFPKGYAIKVLSQTKRGYEQTIERGEQIVFSITLIGSMANYAVKMSEAIGLFANRGIHGAMEYSINSMKEYSLREIAEKGHNTKKIEIEFITPLSLYSSKKKEHSSNSLYYRTNGFISLYQLVMSSANRVSKMAVLYDDCKATVEELSEAINEVTAIASEATLRKCNLRHTMLSTDKRKATKDSMVFDGLVGHTEWKGDVSALYPLLYFCSLISLGDNVVYGMGNIRVSC